MRIGFDGKRAVQNFTGLGNYSRYIVNILWYLHCMPAGLLDGVEVCNENPRHNSHNDRALAYAKEHHLLMTAGSDVHELGDAGGAGLLCPAFSDIKAFARHVRDGQTLWFQSR